MTINEKEFLKPFEVQLKKILIYFSAIYLYNNTMINTDDKKLSGFTFIDLFAGIGGFRMALSSFGAECVFSSEWDSWAQKVYFDNFGDKPHGDITQINEKSIPNHDILCAGFPCQAFSISGKQRGF